MNILGKDGYGWLRPDGSILITDYRTHMATLVGDRDAPEGMSAWLDAVGKLEEQEGLDSNEFARGVPDGEHVGWHGYSSDAGDEASLQRGRMVDLLHQREWVRLGVMVRKGKRVLEAEGCASVLSRRRVELESIADRAEVIQLMANPIGSCTPVRRTVLDHAEVEAVAPRFFADALASLRAGKAFKGGIKERQVMFTCTWSMKLDAFPPEMMPLRAPSLIRHSISAAVQRWSFRPQAHSKVSIRRGESESEYSCDAPPSILALAVEDDDYWLKVPDAAALQGMLDRCGWTENVSYDRIDY